MSFAGEKHVRFWRMNATLLPHHYLSNDSSRMTLGFFIVAALDLLDALETIKIEERQAWIEWIYSCQCPEGGFRGFSGTILNERRNTSNCKWDPANVPATFFALATLLVLGDDMGRVKRKECLEWLPRMQRSDGSFGEVLGDQNSIEGGTDLRFCCCAAGIAFMLQGSDEHEIKSINLARLTQYVESCQSYNGGFGEAPLKEPHSGLTYCAIATLALVHNIQGKRFNHTYRTVMLQEALHWLLDRQTDVLEEEEEDDDEDDDDAAEKDQADDLEYEENANGNPTIQSDAILLASSSITAPRIAGFNGREGKIADTCYCFWNTGALAILGHRDLIDAEAMNRYLLEKVQHMIGGFGKGVGALPDVMHSYLGLAALSITSVFPLKPINASLCISQEAASRLKHMSWNRANSLNDGENHP